MVDEHLHELARQMIYLNTKKFSLIAPIAESIIECDIKDEKEIEHSLDELYDVMLIHELPEALDLYRRLCSHYFSINPEATFEYVQRYRNEFDPDGEKFSKFPPDEDE